MELNAENFRSIVYALRADTDDRHYEKRRHPRVGLCAKVECFFPREGEPAMRIWGNVRDLSRGGIGLYVPVTAAEGDRLLVRLPSGDNDWLMLLYVVRHVLQASDGGWQLGARLVQVATPSAPPPQE